MALTTRPRGGVWGDAYARARAQRQIGDVHDESAESIAAAMDAALHRQLQSEGSFSYSFSYYYELTSESVTATDAPTAKARERAPGGSLPPLAIRSALVHERRAIASPLYCHALVRAHQTPHVLSLLNAVRRSPSNAAYSLGSRRADD